MCLIATEFPVVPPEWTRIEKGGVGGKTAQESSWTVLKERWTDQ